MIRVSRQKKLFNEIFVGNSAAVQHLLDEGADPKVPLDGMLPLVEAARTGDEAVIRILIERGADVNAIAPIFSHSPLTAACGEGRMSSVRVLLEAGADVNYLPEGVRSCITEAANSKHKERVSIVKLLLEAGARPDVMFHSLKGDEVLSQLACCCLFSNPSVLSILIESGANPNRVGTLGSPLTECIEHNTSVNLPVLLRGGGDPTIRMPPDCSLPGYAGLNAIDIAKLKKRKSIIHILSEHGFDCY